MASKRPCSHESGGGDGSPWSAPCPKRHCCCLLDPGFTLMEFMEKLDPPDLCQVQHLCKKYHINVPQPSVSCRLPNYQFHFRNELPQTIFTNRKIKAKNNLVEIVILDASNKIVDYGPLASAEVEIVVLDGDFDWDKHKQWSNEDFKKRLVYPRKDKGSLLKGDLQIKLHHGIGYISDVRFTDNSSWTSSKTFRLGAMHYAGTVMVEEVQAGISNAFRVKDRHGENNQKEYPPSMNDEVYRLKGIRKDGTFHKKLLELDIKNVADFLNSCKDNPENLRRIIQMGKGKWEKTLDHAIESKARCSSMLNGFGNLLPFYQDSLEDTGLHSLQNSNVSTECYDNHLPCYLDCEPPHSDMFTDTQSLTDSTFSFSSTKSTKTIPITGGAPWKSTDYMPNKFDSRCRSSPRRWSILLFVARWKIAALRTIKSKLLATSSLENHADAMGYLYEKDATWEDCYQVLLFDGNYGDVN